MLDQSRKEEAWRLILPYLRNPIPIPLSAPPRSALRQPALCAAIGTCQLFRTICEPILYAQVATDRFSPMFNDSNIASITRRFAHTRRLYIEYVPKGVPPTYEQLLLDRKEWGAIGRTQAETDEATFKEYNLELSELLACLSTLNQLGVRSLFKRLETIAVSPIYGRDTDTYINYEKWIEDSYRLALPTKGHQAAVEIAQRHMAYHQGVSKQWKLFFRAANPRHFCSRDTNGVLNCDRLQWVSDGNLPRGDCKLVFHFGPRIHQLPIVFGRSVVWASDYPLPTDWSIPLEEVGHMIADYVNIRRGTGKLSERAEIDIYCSTAYAAPLADPNSPEFKLPPEATNCTFQPEDQVLLCKEWLERRIAALLRFFKWENDTIRWKASCETPICQACGSGAPGLKEGEWLTGDFKDRGVEGQEGSVREGDDEPIPESNIMFVDTVKGFAGMRL